MDTEKLFRVLKDLQSDEESLTIEEQVSAVRQTLASNTPDGFNAAKTQVKELTDKVKDTSIAYNFSRTENLILEYLDGERYYGQGLVLRLNQIFAIGGYDTLSRLEKYIAGRSDFVRIAQRLSTALADIGIEDYRPDQSEIGIVLPDSDGDLEVFSKRIKDLKLMLTGLARAAGQSPAEVKITRLSNGTLELFSLQNAEVALLFSTLLLNVSAIWDKIAQFKKHIEDTEKNPILSGDGKKNIKAILEAESERIKAEILEELPKQMLVEQKSKTDEDKNEISNHIRVCIHIAFAWLEAGVEVDITPVRLDSPEPLSKKEESRIAVANQANEKLRQIYKLPVESRKLPFKLPAPPEPKEVKKPTKKAAKKKTT